VRLLYELVYQREPQQIETQLGLEFVDKSPEFEKVPRKNPKKNERFEASFLSVPVGERKPLTPWGFFAP
jgi:hypothetical protein